MTTIPHPASPITNPPAASKSRRPPLSWVVGIGAAVATASVWLYRRVAGEPKVLTRAEEKQRRKTLVRDRKKRK